MSKVIIRAKTAAISDRFLQKSKCNKLWGLLKKSMRSAPKSKATEPAKVPIDRLEKEKPWGWDKFLALDTTRTSQEENWKAAEPAKTKPWIILCKSKIPKLLPVPRDSAAHNRDTN